MAVATKHRAAWEKWHVSGTCSFSKEDPRELRSLNRHNVIKKKAKKRRSKLSWV